MALGEKLRITKESKPHVDICLTKKDILEVPQKEIRKKRYLKKGYTEFFAPQDLLQKRGLRHGMIPRMGTA